MYITYAPTHDSSLQLYDNWCTSSIQSLQESTQIYQEALIKSGYDHQVAYQKSIHSKNEETKTRKKNLVQSPIQQECFNENWKSVSKTN